MNGQTQILFESLRRTDNHTLAADQKASFCLAAGVTFLGIYSTLFYSVISDENSTLPTTLICTILGIALLPWVAFFYRIKCIFHPNLEASDTKSIVSFASMRDEWNNFSQFKHHFQTIQGQNFTNAINEDILENHWICAGICKDKMENFKKALSCLWLALSISLVGLATLVYFSEHSEFVKFLAICK